MEGPSSSAATSRQVHLADASQLLVHLQVPLQTNMQRSALRGCSRRAAAWFFSGALYHDANSNNVLVMEGAFLSDFSTFTVLKARQDELMLVLLFRFQPHSITNR